VCLLMCMKRNPDVSADSAADQTFSISPAWDIDKNDVQQLVHLSEEKNSLFRYRSYICSTYDCNLITGLLTSVLSL